MQDENGEYVWRTIKGNRVKIYKDKTLKESMKLHNEYNEKKYREGKLIEDTSEETYFKLSNGKKVKFLDKKEYNKMVENFYSKLTQDEKDAISIWVNDPYIFHSPIYHLKKDYEGIFNNLFNEKAEVLQQDTLLFRRGSEDYLDLKNGVSTDYNMSTSAYNKLPKTMPSGIRFGSQEYYIIAPKGTKVLPIEKVAVNDVGEDKGEKRIFARQHELVLPKGINYEMIEDLSTYERDYWSRSMNVDEKYVIKLNNNKYKKVQYQKPEHTWGDLEEYIVKKGKKDIRIQEVYTEHSGLKKTRKEAIKYRVNDLGFKHQSELYDSYDEAVKAINKYL